MSGAAFVADWPWRCRGALATALAAAYAASAWWQAASGAMLVGAGVSAADLLAKFILVELLVLVAFVPLSWMAIVRRLRGA